MIQSFSLRWLSLNYGVTAACLSQDNNLLLATGARIMEVKINQEGNITNQRYNTGEMSSRLLDPVVMMVQSGAMSMVAITRFLTFYDRGGALKCF